MEIVVSAPESLGKKIKRTSQEIGRIAQTFSKQRSSLFVRKDFKTRGGKT